MSSFGRLIARRLFHAVFVLLGLSVLIFSISRVIPGAPVRLALGPTASQEQVMKVRREMKLDEPIYIQYFAWLQDALHGDWGQSLVTGNNVFYDIVQRFPATLELVLVAMIFAVGVGVPAGVIAATHEHRWQDHFSRLSALFGVSMPRFWIAIVFQIVFAGAVFSLLPLRGRIAGAPPPTVTHLYLVDSLLALQFGTFIDALTHIVMPAIALGVATLAQVMRLVRSDMIEEGAKNYVTAEKAFGLPGNLINYKYKLKNAFTSALTIIGLEFGFLIGNAFLVELVFAWPGMARYGVNAIVKQDFNAIVGVTIVVGLAFVTTNLVVDLMYGYFDPRGRIQEN